jgi:nicotinamide-nucleotide amidase
VRARLKRAGGGGVLRRVRVRPEAACRAALGDLVYGADDQTLATAVVSMITGPLSDIFPPPLITTAESCTGGLLAKYLTDIPGSSAYFRYGWVTYADEAKTRELGVAAETLREHGAVSEPVVKAMALGAVERADAHFGLAISGIAGPDGGTEQKPVGTVCIALAYVNPSEKGYLTAARTFRFTGDRETCR